MAKFNLNFYKGQDLYSDGDIENTIFDIVKSNTDFTEILARSTDWAIMYHLSPIRQNLLNWYDFDKSANLLEIGGGCGALTGLFLNKLQKVTTIELSKRRAEIIYQRYKEYNNLEIIVGNLNDISIEEKFDYITLIGVLEYAGKFIESNNPFKTFLEKVKLYLKPNGKLLIAIENKFGLKYLAGAREEHTGRFFDAIEGYPNDKSIQTFGRKELEDLLYSVGFAKFYFYYPIPDYKLPRVIFSDDYLPDIDDVFDTNSPNFDQNRIALFDERKAFKNIIKNNNFPFFANSFLIEVR
jgi:SAM-dependent methyltransferase